MSLQLICVNYESVWDALKVMSYCEGLHPWDAKVLIHPKPCYQLEDLEVPIHNDEIAIIKAKSPNLNECWIEEVPEYIVCTHALSIHWDGYIINPSKWNEAYLDYDWIGAPWPLANIPNPDWRVGSGGFFICSKRMSDAWKKICNLSEPFDWQIGALYRDRFEAMGMKYAPIELAAEFCKECELEDIEIKEGETFGFHGFQYGNGAREKFRDLVYPR